MTKAKDRSVICFCKHPTGLAGLKTLLDLGANVVAVVCQESESSSPWYREIETLAIAGNFEFMAVRLLSKQPEVWDSIAAYRPDLGYTMLFTQIFPATVIESFRSGLINFHPSLLPKYRGPHPVNWALINGESNTGVTAHFVSPKVDGGSVIMAESVSIEDDDTNVSLMDKLSRVIVDQVETTYQQWLEGPLPATPQIESEASYYPMRCAADGRIDWNSMDAPKVYNLIRALQPPLHGGFFEYHAKQVIARSSSVVAGSAATRPGEIVEIDDQSVSVSTTNGVIRLLDLEDDKARTILPSIFRIGDRLI